MADRVKDTNAIDSHSRNDRTRFVIAQTILFHFLFHQNINIKF